ncbi:hypothetical protein DXG03_003593 [Asterophora parasitica]|uniref:Uncharacterized protein n=1 Tax=Asterophora parasitica TaxID=117018 RepID=A0A9P7G104_9AGAR|nr:hypothetical protein DXG03_003593 [Asterophora parasitica]
MTSTTTTEANVSPQPRKPPLANWPTIKILTPPKGNAIFSPKTDEWCLTYCSQSVTGRVHGKEPFCRSVCIRKVFPHEVKNIIAFKTHRNLNADGKAMYPLPSEGQPASLPRILGGKPTDESTAPPQKTPPEAVKHWDEGWYLWTTQSRLAIHEKTDSMMMDLERQQRANARFEERREVWQDYQDHLAKVASDPEHGQAPENGKSSKWWGPIAPQRPIPEFRWVDHRRLSFRWLTFVTRNHSLLVPVPPDIPPFWDRITKLLAPSHKVLEIFRESVTSGEQRQFAERVWQKAWSNEPFVLASRTFSSVYERWKEREAPPDEDDGRKGST